MSEPAAQPLIKLAVIGSAARTFEDRRVLHQRYSTYPWVTEVIRLLRERALDPSQVLLVSGGSAFADQVAVECFLMDHPFLPEGAPFAGLLLHLPCPFDPTLKRFVGPRRYADALNELHDDFERTQGTSSLERLAEAIQRPNCKVVVHPGGFLDRDRAIAEAHYMIAFSGSDGVAPTKGSGTEFTWRHAPATCVKKCIRIHFPDEHSR